MEQGSEEWLMARLGHITGSRMADVLAKVKYGEASSRANYKTQLVTERITGKPIKSFSNSIMQQGTDREPFARIQYEFENGSVQEVGFIHHPKIAWSGVSVDGLVGNDGIIEIKCPLETTHTNNLLKKEVPSKYVAQVQWGLAVTERQFCDFISFNPDFPDDLQMIVVRVDRDDDYIAKMEEEVIAFNEEIEAIVNQLKGK